MPKSKWKDDPLREVLKQDIVDEKIPPGMKPATAVKLRPEYEAMGHKLFSSRLSGMRKSLSAPPKKSKEEKWNQKNPARIQMKWDVAEGVISNAMDFTAAQGVRALYGKMTAAQFKSRLTSMREIVATGQARAAVDAMNYFNDRLLHPRPKFKMDGEPVWMEHEAKDLLEIDMNDGKHKRMAPKELHESRLQYQDFTLDTFRGHIYQEIQTRKWREQWVEGKKQYALVPPPN